MASSSSSLSPLPIFSISEYKNFSAETPEGKEYAELLKKVSFYNLLALHASCSEALEGQNQTEIQKGMQKLAVRMLRNERPENDITENMLTIDSIKSVAQEIFNRLQELEKTLTS